MKPSTRFSTDERTRVEQAIKDAETRTSAEIIVAVARQSGRYDRAEDLFGLILATLVTLALAFLAPRQPEIGEWTRPFDTALHLPSIVAIFIVTTIIGAVLATRFPILARPLIGGRELGEELRRAGVNAFNTFRVHDTANGSGLLIYVSLFERRVWVSGDRAVAPVLSDEQQATIRDLVLDGFKDGNGPDGLCKAIAHAGEALHEPLPRADDDVDELPNTLHLLD